MTNQEQCRIKPSCLHEAFHFQRPSKDTQHPTTFPRPHDLHFSPCCHHCSLGLSHLHLLASAVALPQSILNTGARICLLKQGKLCHICAQNAPRASHLTRNESQDLHIGHQDPGPSLLLLILTSVPSLPIACSAPAMLTFGSFGWHILPPEVFRPLLNWLLRSLPHHLQVFAQMVPSP